MRRFLLRRPLLELGRVVCVSHTLGGTSDLVCHTHTRWNGGEGIPKEWEVYTRRGPCTRICNGLRVGGGGRVTLVQYKCCGISSATELHFFQFYYNVVNLFWIQVPFRTSTDSYSPTGAFLHPHTLRIRLLVVLGLLTMVHKWFRNPEDPFSKSSLIHQNQTHWPLKIT
jgi:hypothetical protein